MESFYTPKDDFYDCWFVVTDLLDLEEKEVMKGEELVLILFSNQQSLLAMNKIAEKNKVQIISFQTFFFGAFLLRSNLEKVNIGQHEIAEDKKLNQHKNNLKFFFDKLDTLKLQNLIENKATGEGSESKKRKIGEEKSSDPSQVKLTSQESGISLQPHIINIEQTQLGHEGIPYDLGFLVTDIINIGLDEKDKYKDTILIVASSEDKYKTIEANHKRISLALKRSKEKAQLLNTIKISKHKFNTHILPLVVWKKMIEKTECHFLKEATEEEARIYRGNLFKLISGMPGNVLRNVTAIATVLKHGLDKLPPPIQPSQTRLGNPSLTSLKFVKYEISAIYNNWQTHPQKKLSEDKKIYFISQDNELKTKEKANNISLIFLALQEKEIFKSDFNSYVQFFNSKSLAGIIMSAESYQKIHVELNQQFIISEQDTIPINLLELLKQSLRSTLNDAQTLPYMIMKIAFPNSSSVAFWSAQTNQPGTTDDWAEKVISEGQAPLGYLDQQEESENYSPQRQPSYWLFGRNSFLQQQNPEDFEVPEPPSPKHN